MILKLENRVPIPHGYKKSFFQPRILIIFLGIKHMVPFFSSIIFPCQGLASLGTCRPLQDLPEVSLRVGSNYFARNFVKLYYTILYYSTDDIGCLAALFLYSEHIFLRKNGQLSAAKSRSNLSAT